MLIVISKVSDLYKKHSFALIVGPFIKMVEAIFDLLIPLFMKAIIDLNKYGDPSSIHNRLSAYLASFIRLFGTWVSDNQNLNDAIVGGTIILVMGITGFLITMITQYIAANTASKFGSELRDNLYEKILSFSKKEREEIGNNRLSTILNADTYQSQQGVLIFIRLVVRAPFIILGALVFSLLLDWKIGLIFLGVIPIILFIVFFIMARSSKRYVDIQKQLDVLSNKTSDTVQGAKVVRALDTIEEENKNYQDETKVYQDKATNVSKLNALINPLTFAVISLAAILVVYFGGLPILNDNSLSGDLSTTIIAEVAYLMQIFVTLVQLTGVILIFTKANVSNKRINDVLKIIPSIQENEDGLVKIINKGEELFRFNHVSLSFKEGANKALDDINFVLHKGESLGIIGATGSGKSTIVSLLERFIDVSEGEILYKGVNIKDYRLSSLREEIGLVPQQSNLFNETIRSNLLMANQTAQEEDMISALKDAEALEFVHNYEDFINHPVKENGNNFSGGQRQRLCIARALLKNPEIIILDDATSALDLLTEKKVRENIEKRGNDITKIIISQRASTIRQCDLILVLDGGSIVGMGKHQELLKTCQVYSDIYQTQLENGGFINE